MSNLKTILKYNLLQTFNKLFKGKKNRGNVAAFTLMGILGVIVLAAIFYYIYLFAYIFDASGHLEGVFYLICAVMTLVTLMSTLRKSNSILFRMKDYDLLATLPIKSKDILVSKLISLFGFNPIMFLIIGLGSMIIYSLFTPVGILFWILGSISFLLMPIIPIVIGAFIAYLFGFIPLNQKIKNLLSTALYLVFLVVMMIFYMTAFNGEETEIIAKLDKVLESLKNAYFFAPTIVSSILGNLTSALIYFGVSLILGVLFICAVSIGFNKIIDNFGLKGSNGKYKYNEKQYVQSSQIKTLFKKEFIHYINMPNYIMNTVVGPIISIIMTTIMMLNFQSNTLEEMGVGIEYLYLILVPVYIFTFGLATTTSSSLSLEGKNFWIVKTSPVTYKEVFMSKIILGLVVYIPFLFVDMIIISIFMKSFNLNLLLVGLSILVYIVFSNVLGLYLNIKKYNFNDEPIKAIKGSMPVLFNMLICFGLVIIEFLIITFLISLLNNITLSLFILLIFNGLLCCLAILLLLNNGKHSFNNIEY